MGNCLQTYGGGQQKQGDEEKQQQHEEELKGRSGGLIEEGGLRVKIVLTKEELEWLMFQLKEKGGKSSLQDLLEELEEGRRRTHEAWKPSLESIMESSEVGSTEANVRVIAILKNGSDQCVGSTDQEVMKAIQSKCQLGFCTAAAAVALRMLEPVTFERPAMNRSAPDNNIDSIATPTTVAPQGEEEFLDEEALYQTPKLFHCFFLSDLVSDLFLSPPFSFRFGFRSLHVTT
ncbi:hypothetical protein NE237_012993 [Protea cynaroides]|uniref:Uncharacterized protein n=1 Tax=Protea cynaroides TaxID=273540 RepID=A0A9Q0JZD3_9MAGN|nr:hypothetical protein NE237_012993 [Protea cynaroides]